MAEAVTVRRRAGRDSKRNHSLWRRRSSMNGFRKHVAAATIGVASAIATPSFTVAQYYGGEQVAPSGAESPEVRTPARPRYRPDESFHSRTDTTYPATRPGATEWAKQSRLERQPPSARYGSRADAMPYDKEILLGFYTGSVNVSHNETVKFRTPVGREFRWRFDTARRLEQFPLARIAPPDVAVDPRVTVYVTGDSPMDAG
jgi:hypothetical protein